MSFVLCIYSIITPLCCIVFIDAFTCIKFFGTALFQTSVFQWKGKPPRGAQPACGPSGMYMEAAYQYLDAQLGGGSRRNGCDVDPTHFADICRWRTWRRRRYLRPVPVRRHGRVRMAYRKRRLRKKQPDYRAGASAYEDSEFGWLSEASEVSSGDRSWGLGDGVAEAGQELEGGQERREPAAHAPAGGSAYEAVSLPGMANSSAEASVCISHESASGQIDEWLELETLFPTLGSGLIRAIAAEADTFDDALVVLFSLVESCEMSPRQAGGSNGAASTTAEDGDHQRPAIDCRKRAPSALVFDDVLKGGPQGAEEYSIFTPTTADSSDLSSIALDTSSETEGLPSLGSHSVEGGHSPLAGTVLVRRDCGDMVVEPGALSDPFYGDSAEYPGGPIPRSRDRLAAGEGAGGNGPCDCEVELEDAPSCPSEVRISHVDSSPIDPTVGRDGLEQGQSPHRVHDGPEPRGGAADDPTSAPPASALSERWKFLHDAGHIYFQNP